MKKMSFNEKLIYAVYCVLSLGGVWVIKVIIKKAVIEAIECTKE